MNITNTLIESSSPQTALLKVKQLGKQFSVKLGFLKSGKVSAVEDVSFEIREGETLGIVGESGCGKSTTARLLLRLIEPDTGDIVFDGKDLKAIKPEDQKQVRRNMQMVFQDPYSSLNPRMSIQDNIGFPLKVNGYSKQEIRDTTLSLLEQVGLPKSYANYLPSQLSGGQLQRVNIARALALKPKVVICDEAVSALDKSIQAQVLNLLKDLQEQLQLTYLFISHDLNVVEYVSDRVLVMYMGQVVESCSAEELYQNPLHPYTKALLASIPKMEFEDHQSEDAVEYGDGEMPSPLNPPSGCRFRTRCPIALDICAQEHPGFRYPVAEHAVACHLYQTDQPSIPTAALG
ncbi:MAG: dipeptide ABC transporter ATP-binding protein [Elainellaceae cyanobacterium]